MTDLAAPADAVAVNGTFPADDAAGQTVAAIAESEKISADEIALYDRQIRLWGVKAQSKIRTANILLVSIKALANEIAKNLVLAGIGSITLADHESVTEDDLGAQFFITDSDVGKNRAEAAAPQVQKLNPRVRVNVYAGDIRTETEASFYANFDVIIATDLDFNSTNTLNLCARLANRPFYAGASHGLYGYIFADLIKHKFVVEREVSNKTTQVGPESSTRSVLETSSKKENGKSLETVTKQEIYSPIMAIKDSPLPPEIAGNHRKLKKVHPLLTCVRALWEYQFQAHGVYPSHEPQQLQLFTMMATEKHKLHLLPSSTLTAEFLRSFLQNLGSELAPVTAFLGGQLAQDVINVLGQREQPIQNLMLFDGEESAGPVYTLHPIFADNPITALPSIPMPVEAISIDD
ncbi:E1 ubiquitin-activating enzyme [Ascochyta rabiei]|uniref:Ubiquitin-like 1-activating enzyme E1A n=1 Tax=Didymella rabiei TaxID=5454 RepID=A0A162XF64_DIDRA|nr:E1 ubiquitin-activating enzyme [Ascochyta rabiei]KZM19513.1 small protein activating enzyme [Ascochyta rabiei]UPX12466.1 E1 ubiquitin-activating enzyme [Ascochyta rabiei]